MFEYIKIYMNKGVSIFDDPNHDNDVVKDDMQYFYVSGYGTTDISNLLTKKPLLTGRMISLQNWDFIAADITVYDIDIYAILNIIAETVARQRENMYDITCMQIEDYETYRFGLERHTYASKNAIAWRPYTYLTEKDSDDRPYDAQDMLGRWIGEPTRLVTENKTSEEVEIGDGYTINCATMHMELQSYIYIPKFDYYTVAMDIYTTRTTTGDKIFDEELV